MNNLIKKRIITVCIIFMCISCNKGLKPSEYIKYVQDEKNGFVQRQELGNLSVQMMYTPAEYIVIQQFKKNDIPALEFEKRKEALANATFFEFDISGEPISEIDPLYLNYNLQNDIKFVQGIDTLDCVIYQPEPINTMKKRLKAQLVFGQTTPENGIVVVVGRVLSSVDILFPYDFKKLHSPAIQLN